MDEVKKYQIIYADPPWSYNDKMDGHQGAETHYRTMNNVDIANLPIHTISDNNCCLFLWATSPLLPEAIETIYKWGFKYKTVAFCWSKTSKNAWVSNMGRWTMGNIELCLLGVKGKLQRQRVNVKQLVHSERTEHSKKPDEVRKRIVELMGDLPRIELFARGDRQKDLFGFNRFEGWDVWGNEVESDIELGEKE